jgi:hypothetical protein
MDVERVIDVIGFFRTHSALSTSHSADTVDWKGHVRERRFAATRDAVCGYVFFEDC